MFIICCEVLQGSCICWCGVSRGGTGSSSLCLSIFFWKIKAFFFFFLAIFSIFCSFLLYQRLCCHAVKVVWVLQSYYYQHIEISGKPQLGDVGDHHQKITKIPKNLPPVWSAMLVSAVKCHISLIESEMLPRSFLFFWYLLFSIALGITHLSLKIKSLLWHKGLLNSFWLSTRCSFNVLKTQCQFIGYEQDIRVSLITSFAKGQVTHICWWSL